MPRTKRRPENLTDWRAIENEREKYAAYLCSREWGVLKEAVHKRSRGTCERCGILPGNAVHHLTYERKYCEELEDLQHTCHACHDFTHGKSEFDPILSREWSRYVMKAYPLDPVPMYVALLGPNVDIAVRIVGSYDPRAIVMLLADHGAKSPLQGEDFLRVEQGFPAESLPFVCSEGYMLRDAIREGNVSLQKAIGLPFDLARWLAIGTPKTRCDLHEESIRQVRKCL